MSRIAPLQPPYPPGIQAAFNAIMPSGVPPLAIFTTLARNPRVFARFRAGSLLDEGTLSLREREIVIDRACARCGSEYEWGVHVAVFAHAAGLAGDAVRAIVRGTSDDPCWTAREALLIRLVDALHDTAGIDDPLWSALKGEFSDEQLIELIVLTGFYHTVSFVANSLCLPPEQHAARFPA
jgi:alkylhydroperoxidase family enzyme